MGNTTGRIRGKVTELSGKAKASVGKALGNEQMKAEGTAKALRGKATQELIKASERIKGSIEQVAGSAKKRVGVAIKNQQMQAEGKLTELKGGARRRINK
jgi:uncharacterized protein YjbJ (UPF0337 family)